MKICLLAESGASPVVASALSQLSRRHTVMRRDPATVLDDDICRSTELRDVDVYLLKSRSAAARTMAGAAQEAGALVINTPDATAAALDRARMAALLRKAHVCTPHTSVYRSLNVLALTCATSATVSWPLVIKSRYSRRGDLVTVVRQPLELLALLPQWGAEPVIAQQFVSNDGFDLKFWVIDRQIYLARRPGALSGRITDRDVAVDPAGLPTEWLTTALAAGAALGLEVFGADCLVTADGLAVIDVNAFPGFRCATGADLALTNLVERRAAEWRSCA